MRVSQLMSGVAIAALTIGWSTPAYAQSTGTQEVEKVTVTGERSGTGGTIVKEQRPKSRSTITQKYLGTQPGGQTVIQGLNLVPGMNFTNNDPYGSSGGNIRLRGFDGARVSLTMDGVPLNDTGNYAVFTNQMVDPEYLERATVNTGTTDVDSPTASATGGTINLVTRKPYKDLTMSMTGSAGSWDYNRFAAILDSGEYNGVSAFGGISFQEYDKFKGPGTLKKTQGNARIYQEIGEKSFISLIGHYNENRNNFYRNLTLAQIATFGDMYENFSSCTRDAANNLAGVDGLINDVQNDGLATLAGGADNILNPGSCTNYYNLRINPSNTGNLRLQSSFALSDELRLTIDPSWQYVKANGGGTTVISETDTRLGTGVNLNNDLLTIGATPDLLDSIRLYTPNNTNTSRYGVTASVIWQPSETDTFRAAYTGDHGRHRQTGVFSKLTAAGDPVDIFGGLDRIGTAIEGTDGNVLRGRDRLSHAILNQISASYTGRFWDEALLIDVGLRAPFFSRDLNQYCYTQTGTSNVRCTKEAFTDADLDGIGTLASQGATVFAAPLTTNFEYDAVLPNVGISYEFEPSHIVFASYAEGFSAPRTDNLYAVFADEATGVVKGLDDIQPETTQSYDLGYRFHGDNITASAAMWYNAYQNRVVSSFDVNTGLNIDRNLGEVIIQGIDAELGWKANENLVVYGSVSYLQSEVQDNIPAVVLPNLECAPVLGKPECFVPTAGKELVETPSLTMAARAMYAINDHISVGVQGKYVGDRWATDVNDQLAKSYMLFDADATFDLTALGWANTVFQFNAINILNESYLGSISTTNHANTLDINPTATVVNRGGAAPSYGIGAPQTFQMQIKTKF